MLRCVMAAILLRFYNSCRNRNCPKCGNLKKEQWVLDRSTELLPVPYFHTVFTVPHELNGLFLANQKLMYSLLFKAASKTLSKLALDPKYLGAQVGVTMVLHSWGQNLSFHPHVHCIVPGGGLSPSGVSFVRSRKKFFIPVKVLSKVFRGIFLALLKKAFYDKKVVLPADLGSFQGLLDSLYAKSWVVYCKRQILYTYKYFLLSDIISPRRCIMSDMIKKLSINEWDALINDYRTSGLAAAQWCEKQGLKVHQLHFQINKRKKQKRNDQNIQWIPLHSNSIDSSSAITVKIGNAEILVSDGFNKKLFTEVVNSLQVLC